MKKHLLTIFAVLLGIGFSAFRPAKQVQARTTETPYNYWYSVTDGALVGQVQFIGGYTKTEVLNDIYCNDSPYRAVCMVGSTYELQYDNDIPGDHGDNYIRERDE